MSKQVLSDLDFNSASRIINLPDGTDPQHPATVQQLNAAIEGLAWKDSCRVRSQVNITIATPGASIDGVALAASDRVLLGNQTLPENNGIYIWNGAAVPMTRALDASTAGELEQAVVSVEEGTDADTSWRQTEVNLVLGTDPVVFAAFGTSVAAASETVAGKAEIATQVETDAGSDDLRIVTPLKLATWSNRKLKFAADIGDNSSTSITFTHNLGTRDVQVTVFRNSGNRDEVLCDVEHTSTTACTLKFAVAPTTNQFRAVALG